MASQVSAQPRAVCMVIVFRVVTASDSGLVRHDHQRIPEGARSQAEANDAWHELRILGAMDVTVIDVDDTIAIQEQGGPQRLGGGECHGCIVAVAAARVQTAIMGCHGRAGFGYACCL